MRIASKLVIFSIPFSLLLAAGCTSPEKRAGYSSPGGTGGQVISSPAYGSTAPPPGTYPPGTAAPGTASPRVYSQNTTPSAAAGAGQAGVRTTEGAGTTDNALASQVRQAINTGNLGSVAQNIQVTARNGTVTLTGTVPSEQQREVVETLVSNTSGVVGVNNQLQVGPPGSLAPGEPLSAPAYEGSAGHPSPPDNGLVSTVQHMINNSPSLAPLASTVHVAAQNGSVTLTGTVPTEQDKQRIDSVVRNLEGVNDVNNELQVSASPTGRPGEGSRVYSPATSQTGTDELQVSPSRGSNQ